MNLAIIGGGSWGTALAIVLAPRFDGVRLWVNGQLLVDNWGQHGLTTNTGWAFQLDAGSGYVTRLD